MTTITGPLRNPVTGALMPGARISIATSAPVADDGATYLTVFQVVVADAEANIALELAAPATGTAEYVFRIPETSPIAFVLHIADGPPTTLHALIAAQHPAVAASPLASHADTLASESVLGHIRAHVDQIDEDGYLVIGAGVTSVNGATGVVILLADDVDADPTGTAAGLVTTEATTRATADSDHAALTTAAHGGIVATGDSRLSDARTPTGAAGGVLGGTYPSPGFAADMATQAELDAHAAAADPHPGYLTPAEGNAAYQPLDSDLTAIAALTTTSYGRALLALADAAAGRTALGAGVGSVTSVDLTVPGVLFSVAGGPVTGAGTLALSLLTQSANTVLAGPASGGAATPTMRALVATDTPAAAILAAANTFTLAQTITGAALGITITGAAAAGTPSIVTTAPTQVVGATAGTPLAITASAAIAGSATVGAAAGGAIALTAGNAARLTSGNAAGGNIILMPGAGIGTGLAGAVLLPQSASNTQGNGGLAFGANATDGSALNIQAFNSNFNFYSQNLQVGKLGYALGFVLLSTSGGYSFSANTGNDGARDLALSRNTAAVVEINTGTAGQWGALKAGTRDTSTGAVTNGLTLGHQISTGTPGSGMGAGILFNLNSSTTPDQNAAQIAALWPDAAGATHATRSGAIALSTVSIAGALTERLRVDAGVVAGAAVATTIGLMVWDVDAAALKRVSVGAADSGGSGFKLLRIAN